MTLLELINTGFEHAVGEIVHLLQCGVEVNEGWAGPAVQRFDDPSIAAVSPLLLGTRGLRRNGTAGICYDAGGRRRLCDAGPASDDAGPRASPILGPTLSAGFYRREAVRDAGAVDVAMGEQFADVDLALSLQTAGYRAICEPSSQVLGRPPQTERDRFVDGLRAERLFWKHAPAMGWPRSLALHALLVAAEALWSLRRPLGLIRLLGRVAACLEIPLRGRNGRRGKSEVSARRSCSPPLRAAGRTVQPSRDPNGAVAKFGKYVA
jgi:hypothetical protein